MNQTIVGLNETEAKTLLKSLTFTIAGETKQGTEFKNFTQNEDGSFTASYQVQLSVEANTREVMKEISENLATAELTGYKRTGTTYSIGENGSQTEYSNSENLSVTIQNRGTGVVSFVNTYAPDAVDISILKINDDANPEALAGTDPNISRRFIAAGDREPEKTNAPGDRRQRNKRDLPPWWNLRSVRIAGFGDP